MIVYKFGGASIETPERAQNITQIIRQFPSSLLVVVMSAKGKTTNALESVYKAYTGKQLTYARELFDQVVAEHQKYARDLLEVVPDELEQQLGALAMEVEWILNEELQRPADYYYDQIVSIGELFSTAIMAAYWKKEGLPVQWIDIRDYLKTDEQYRDAGILWEETAHRLQSGMQPLLNKPCIILTQGFIGSTLDNASVTLGREGSDYTAAVLANMLGATEVTIWKDVPSLLNADPKLFPNTVALDEISFHEVIEMAYYGAQVIHPKTIKPLFQKSIPLRVRCFLDPSKPGTLIHQTSSSIAYPPLMVLKTRQILLQVSTRDYSFITEDNLSRIYNLFHKHRIRINMIQNAAISFVACVDEHADRLPGLLDDLQTDYEVKRNENLFLFTVRHYTQSVLDQELRHRTVLLEQRTRHTVQMVVR